MDEDFYKGMDAVAKGSGNLLRLRDALRKQRGLIDLNPPAEDKARGEYAIGTLWKGERPAHIGIMNFGIREHEWCQHLAIYGRSGGGKSNTLKIILNQLANHDRNFMLLDWKREYRNLLTLENFREMFVFTVGREDVAPFRFNFLVPPKSFSPETYLGQLVDVLAFSFFLGDGATSVLRNALEFVYANNGVFEGVVENPPTWRDVRNYLQNEFAKLKGYSREHGWYESSMRAVEELCRRSFGLAMNPKPEESFPLEDLLEQKVVFEVDGLPSKNARIFFTQALVLWIHLYRLANPKESQGFHALVIEEAQNCLSRFGQQRTDTETVIEKAMREMRALGHAIILVTQHPYLLPLQAYNVYVTLSLNLKHMDDIKAAAKSMLLGWKEESYLGMLPVGYAIVKLQDRVVQPFLVKIPVFNNISPVPDQQVKARMRAVSPKSVRKHLNQPEMETFPVLGGRYSVRADELRLLEDILGNPFSQLKERFDRMDFSVRSGERAKEKLLDKGLIKSHFVQTSKFGNSILLQLNASGIQALKELGFPPPQPLHGGLVHAFWCHSISQHLRAKGYEVSQEENNVDVIARKEGNIIYAEVETAKSYPLVNIEKSLDSDADEIWSLATDRQAYAIIKRQLESVGLLRHPKVKLDLVQNILE